MPAVRPRLRAVGHGVPTAHGPKWADSCGSRWEQRVLLRPPVDEQLGRNALREVRESDHPMTAPDPLALAEEAEEWVSGFTSPAARELTAVVMVRSLTAALRAALRAAHEENERLVTQAAELGKWRDAVLNAAVVDWTYRKEHETDPVRAVNDLVCYALDVEREALRKENQRLREALRPFAHPDLREILSGNRCGGASIVFGRNKALLTINDFVRADAALAGGKGEG